MSSICLFGLLGSKELVFKPLERQMRTRPMLLLILSLLAGTWCPAPASCQSPPASAPTPEIGGVRDPGVINRQLTSSPAIVVHPPPGIILGTGSGAVDPPTRGSPAEIEHAL